MEAMKIHALDKLMSAIEPMLRRIVKEEVELALIKHLASNKRQCVNSQIQPSASCLQLKFTNSLPLPIFTGARIEGENSINIAVVDALTGQVVISGPESLMKVEIVVLEGDFDGDEEENWTYEEFKSNIVREREGKPPLLFGDAFLNLIEGTGAFGELMFTDNSSWTRSRKFRLGARVESGYSNGKRVMEAKSKPFMVKDHRGELYKKHHPPLLHDEVWRLEKIAKDGAFHKRLSSENVKTVRDFLTLLNIDSSRLRNADAVELVKNAFEHWDNVVSFENTSVAGVSSHFSSHPCPTESPLMENFENSFSSYHKPDGFGLPNYIGSPSYFSPSTFARSINDCPLEMIDNVDSRFDSDAHGFSSQDFYSSSSTNFLSFETDPEIS
ncbi:hypothetical protein QJS10_CPA08g01640 [Acorus calamus]|uniref:Calmodulin-binding protein 60 A-like n=1 Tax=Acorus calamus TaxID=4465 RepID=A0AAV9EBR9_ACOCL|nr:hypothetical protein QJS10_CPA08g01640 [Acorus calamus]